MRSLVGYSEIAKCLQNLILQKYLKEGKNSLSVEGYRWSRCSLSEDQDFWRLKCIQRTVFLHHVQKHI